MQERALKNASECPALHFRKQWRASMDRRTPQNRRYGHKTISAYMSTHVLGIIGIIYTLLISLVSTYFKLTFPGPFLEKGVKSSLKLKFRSRFMPMALVAYRAVNVGSLLSGGGQFLRVAALCSH